MQTFDLQIKNRSLILALGAESAGNFSIYNDGKIYFSDDFGDLLDNKNWLKYNSELNRFLRENKIKPEIIITDLHPLYKTTALGQKLAKKYDARHIQVQHHLAHIFSCMGENVSISNFQFPISKQIQNSKFKIQNSAIGIALDGTGYGLDGKIWGGEVFKISNSKFLISNQIPKNKFQIERIGKLENQTLIGGDLAMKEPARMLINILSKFLPKDEVYKQIKKFYTRNQFELLYNQLRANFNCQETSSTGRVLDAVSVLLGFSGNQRNYKHEPAILLEKNSTLPYHNLKPKIRKGDVYELDTTYLFKYLFKYLHRDKRRLAATAQLYIAEGLYKIVKTQEKSASRRNKTQIFLAGGISKNKIISKYLISKAAIVNSVIPRGDAGISFGQLIYFLSQ